VLSSKNIPKKFNFLPGLRFERRMFHATFATVRFFPYLLKFLGKIKILQADQKEGMSAFVEKRKPKWQNA